MSTESACLMMLNSISSPLLKGVIEPESVMQTVVNIQEMVQDDGSYWRSLASSERLTLLLVLDFWNGSGHVELMEPYRIFDSSKMANLKLALKEINADF